MNLIVKKVREVDMINVLNMVVVNDAKIVLLGLILDVVLINMMGIAPHVLNIYFQMMNGVK
jgi:hypothetical protein